MEQLKTLLEAKNKQRPLVPAERGNQNFRRGLGLEPVLAPLAEPVEVQTPGRYGVQTRDHSPDSCESVGPKDIEDLEDAVEQEPENELSVSPMVQTPASGILTVASPTSSSPLFAGLQFKDSLGFNVHSTPAAVTEAQTVFQENLAASAVSEDENTKKFVKAERKMRGKPGTLLHANLDEVEKDETTPFGGGKRNFLSEMARIRDYSFPEFDDADWHSEVGKDGRTAFDVVGERLKLHKRSAQLYPMGAQFYAGVRTGHPPMNSPLRTLPPDSQVDKGRKEWGVACSLMHKHPPLMDKLLTLCELYDDNSKGEYCCLLRAMHELRTDTSATARTAFRT